MNHVDFLFRLSLIWLVLVIGSLAYAAMSLLGG
jgi:hypothetical protein